MSAPQSPRAGIEIPTVEQLNALADVLGYSLHAGKDELERNGNPAKIRIKDYLLGCASVIATIREMARIIAGGGDPFVADPTPGEISRAIQDITEGPA